MADSSRWSGLDVSSGSVSWPRFDLDVVIGVVSEKCEVVFLWQIESWLLLASDDGIVESVLCQAHRSIFACCISFNSRIRGKLHYFYFSNEDTETQKGVKHVTRLLSW